MGFINKLQMTHRKPKVREQRKEKKRDRMSNTVIGFAKESRERGKEIFKKLMFKNVSEERYQNTNIKQNIF